jgi:hypothetical protein
MLCFVFVQHSELEARVLPIPAGTGGIRITVLSASSGDTLMLTTSGGTYHETDRVKLPAVPLTIMADPALSVPPVWISDGNCHLRVFHDLVVKGIRFDGQSRTEYAIRSYASEPNKIVVTVHDCPGGIHFTGVCDAIISNSIFTKCGVSAIQSPISTVLTHLCTFQNRRNYRRFAGDESCFNADPLYFDAEAGDFPCFPTHPV